MTTHRLTYPLFGFMILASSCSQEDVNPNDNNNREGRIEFRASLPGVTSRATEITGSTIEHFQVSSLTDSESSLLPYFLDKTFTKNSETGTYFSTDPECIWPNNNDAVRFMAFYPSCEEMRLAGSFGDDVFILPTSEEPVDSYTLSSFRIARDIADQVDFVTAIGTGNLLDNEDTPIDLNFRHQLSRIQLKAWGASESYKLEIAGVRFGGVVTGGVFNFASQADQDGTWTEIIRGNAEYIFCNGDGLVILDKSEDSPLTAEKAVSILGKKVGEGDGYENSAMLIPAANRMWNYQDNASNGENNSEGMYFSVLMRITDTTPYAPGSIVYPYVNNAEGMEVIYLAIDGDNKVVTRLYLRDDRYFTDSEYTDEFVPEENDADIKAFGWAALPVEDEWHAGYTYTYTLNYTNGVGLRNPTDPQPGKPIISDKVLVNVEMTPWQPVEDKDVTVPRR